MKTFLLSTLTLLPTLSFAAPAPNNCVPARQAKADVTITRVYWEQVDGNYKLKNEVVCKNTLDVGVLPGVAAGCMYPVLANCPVVIDGQAHKIIVSGMIYHNESLGVPTKHFTASYHLDRNSGTVTTGEASSSDAFTADLSLKNLGVSIQSKLDGPASGSSGGTASRDGLVIDVIYGDKDAP